MDGLSRTKKKQEKREESADVPRRLHREEQRHGKAAQSQHAHVEGYRLGGRLLLTALRFLRQRLRHLRDPEHYSLWLEEAMTQHAVHQTLHHRGAAPSKERQLAVGGAEQRRAAQHVVEHTCRDDEDAENEEGREGRQELGGGAPEGLAAAEGVEEVVVEEVGVAEEDDESAEEDDEEDGGQGTLLLFHLLSI